jgi:hypothetical protein
MLMDIDKQNGNVAFNEESHRYWNVNDESKTYISVTTLIHEFSQPFDADFWSAYKALEKLLDASSWKLEKPALLKSKKFNKDILEVYGIKENDFNKEQQAILDAWEDKKNESCIRGTKIHAEIENSFYKKKKNITLDKFGVGGKFSCKPHDNSLDLEYGVYPEYLIYKETKDGILNLAGQIDLIIKSGKDIILADHKTNEKIDLKAGYNSETKGTYKMRYPLNNLDDCNYNHYCLQLSTYAWMLEQLHPEFNIKALYINHYDHQGKNTIYKCPYLKDEVIRMLKFYKKQLMIADTKKKYKKIEY